MAAHNYPSTVSRKDQRDEYDEAFNEGETDNEGGCLKNDYAAGSPGWSGYEAGCAAFQPIREDWEAQASYDARWGASLEMPAA